MEERNSKDGYKVSRTHWEIMRHPNGQRFGISTMTFAKTKYKSQYVTCLYVDLPLKISPRGNILILKR